MKRRARCAKRRMEAAMPMLDQLMMGKTPPGGAGEEGGDPRLEQLLGRIVSMQGDVKGPGGGMPPVGAVQGGPGGAPMTPPGPLGGAPMMQGTPMAPKEAGASAPMAPEQANLTYQMLIKA